MSYASLLFVAFVVVPPSRLSFFLLWLCRISSFFSIVGEAEKKLEALIKIESDKL